MCAAVADYAPETVATSKIKRERDEVPVIHLRKNRDIAAALGQTKREGQILVGFALETDDEQINAIGKMERKNFDIIVLNSLRDKGAGFGTDTNKVTIFCADGQTRPLPLMSKSDVAKEIIDSITAFEHEA